MSCFCSSTLTHHLRSPFRFLGWVVSSTLVIVFDSNPSEIAFPRLETEIETISAEGMRELMLLGCPPLMISTGPGKSEAVKLLHP
jgi:hypothetical protein